MNQKEKIFLSVLDSYKGIIYKVANAYCYDKSDQDDLIQEIAVQIWQSLESYNSQYKWSTYIYRIAINTCISFYRKNKNRQSRTVTLDPLFEIPNSLDEPSCEQNFILLRQFIKELTEIDRALIMLHLEGLSTKEIADVIATTQTNVTTKISRIKKRLRAKFENFKNNQNG